MSDRSFGDFVGGGLLWTAVIKYFPQIIGGLFAFVGKFIVAFILFGFVGYFIMVFSGSEDPRKGPVADSEVRISAVGTLDNLRVTAWNSNTSHEITLLSMNCGGESVMLRHIEPGSSQNYSTFAGNIMRGPIQCEVIQMHSK